MIKLTAFWFPALFLCLSVTAQKSRLISVSTTDIDHFWRAYDKISTTNDSALQLSYLNRYFISKGSPGLRAIMEVRSTTNQDILAAIKSYPKFWRSIRHNTKRAAGFAAGLNKGVEKLRALYPSLKPAPIYFTVGALRTNGTVHNGMVLIGSELAMTDSTTVSSEFTGTEQQARRNFFDTNPINNLVLLNLHEYVHTQQKPIVHNLLSEVLYEGVAEFVSVKAFGGVSATPAISYGAQHNSAVRKRFEQEMFYSVNRSKWLWSNAQNEFGIRDLGYYIGYRICDLYYNSEADKSKAISRMIELDYENENDIETFVDNAKFFSAPLADLYSDFESSRPTVTRILPFSNQAANVSPATTEIIIEFSQPLNGFNTGIDLGPLGLQHLPKITSRNWLPGNKAWKLNVSLEPNKQYQILIDNNFRTAAGIPLKPYLIEFTTFDK